MSKTPIDWQTLAKITNNNQQLACEIIAMLVKELPDRQQKLAHAYANNNWEKLLDHTHKLHGSASYCAAISLRDASAELEKKLKNKNYTDIKPLVENINREIANFLKAAQ